jgi:hypothetical protein
LAQTTSSINSERIAKLADIAYDIAGITRNPKCYLAGPMRGCADYNFPAFHAAAAELRVAGWEVFSPAERDEADPNVDLTSEAAKAGKPVTSLAYFMQFDLAAVCTSDAVILLPGWETSQGARLEVHTALEVGVKVFLFESGEEVTSIPVRPSEATLDFGPEFRATDPTTGGSKGRKQAVFANISLVADVYEARVHGFGVMKYPDEAGAPNWSRGMPWSWFYDALRRHIAAYWSGEDINPESGLPHLAHARWMISNLLEYSEYGLGTDDRPTWRKRAA